MMYGIIQGGMVREKERNMIDKGKALAVFGISEEEYDALLKEFAAQAGEMVAIAESAIKNGDAETAARKAHALKGVADNMRLNDCYNAAMAFESALRENDSSSIDYWISELRRFIQEVKIFIEP
jgi:HPt (histidine-containing phosphotransfer) domain-containing protein